MNEMELRNDPRICTGVDRWTVARCSTLSADVCGAEKMFAEKQSGIKTDRAALARCLRSLAPGDVLLVTKLDRLARSTRDLLNTLAHLIHVGSDLH
jgi:DNA invertase Pin-like site-specific DNA recombinase